MQQILERIGVVKNENGDSFSKGSAVVLFLLLLTFIGSTVYILIDSLQ